MEKRNKKLLEWVGVETIIAIDNGDMIWRDKEGNDWYAEYFTNSLDACFKWLVPKLNELGWGIGIMPCGPIHSPLWYADMFNIQKELHIRETNPREDTPALALCLAIEKLIDGDKEV